VFSSSRTKKCSLSTRKSNQIKKKAGKGAQSVVLTAKRGLEMASPWCTRSFLSSLLICIAVALITYNAVIIFATHAHLRSDLSTSSLHSHRTLAFSHKPRSFHTAVTASDSIYNTWQCRVMYYWFKKARESRVGSDMGGFTRILHSGKPDSFMKEIPTFVAEPLPDGTDQV
jgi:hydroxyproline O-arabinosyltransferase